MVISESPEQVATSGLAGATRVTAPSPLHITRSVGSVSVVVFDGAGKMWLRQASATVLEPTATGRPGADESAAEAAYRLQVAALGLSVPLDEAGAWYPGDDAAAIGLPVFVGFMDAEVLAEAGLVGFPLAAVRSMVASASDLLGPRTREVVMIACDAFEARKASKARSASRHPSASAAGSTVWKPRPRRDPLAAPDTVDVRLLGTCQLRCEWCWGPEHARRGSVSAEHWCRRLRQLAGLGTTQAIISGGEPTLSPILRPVVHCAKASGLKVTLSTNGIKLPEHTDLLPFIDDIGIPVDGSTVAMNERMRKGSARFQGWERAINAIKLVQEMNRSGESGALITIRTVVARPNLHDVPNLPAALDHAGVDLAQVRVKLYQVEPFGPHYSDTDFETEWAITPDEAIACGAAARAAAPEAHIEMQLYSNTVGRYFLLDPDGWATGTDEDHDGQPVEVRYGNLIEDLDGTLEQYRAHQRSLGAHAVPDG